MPPRRSRLLAADRLLAAAGPAGDLTGSYVPDGLLERRRRLRPTAASRMQGAVSSPMYRAPMPATDEADDPRDRNVRSAGGRPLDRSLDDLIRSVTLQLIEDVGYHRMTMDQVATTARVGKATIYRRWRSKEDLLISLIDDASHDLLVVPATGSLRRDLQLFLASLVDVLNSPGGRASRALLGLLPSEPTLAEAYQRGPLAQWGAAFAEVFRQAAARGEVGPGAETSLAAEAGSGVLLQRWLFASLPLDRAVVDKVVDEVMMPLLTESAARTERLHD